MSKINAITENWAFTRAYKKGENLVSPILVTYVVKNNKNNLQVGITTSKKIGNAVKRARCRRVIRAAFSAISNDLKSGYDLVFVARTKTSMVKSTEIEKVMREHLQKAGVLE